MLKIKDNVDLKELEKFGFKYYEGKNYNFYENKSQENEELTYFVDCDLKNITVSTFDGDEVEVDNLLYDLIKADLVEKAED
jgi:uncharacterized membrane protein YfhO